jgi:hypothetical protein
MAFSNCDQRWLAYLWCTAQDDVRPGNRPRVGRRTMKMFETATTMLLAVATQALAIGVIFSF